MSIESPTPLEHVMNVLHTVSDRDRNAVSAALHDITDDDDADMIRVVLDDRVFARFDSVVSASTRTRILGVLSPA